MIPINIRRYLTRELSWAEVDGGSGGSPDTKDPSSYKAWEIGPLIDFELPPLSHEGLVTAIYERLCELLVGVQIEPFNEHWRLVYGKYGFLHLSANASAGGERYFIEIFSDDPHVGKKIDDAVLSNTRYPLGGKHFYM